MIRAVVLALLVWAPDALAAEYRAFTLTDGRSFVGEVLASEATGLRVRTAQGEAFVPYDQLVDMAPADETAFAAQDDVYVYVASDAPYRSGFQASYRALPGVTLVGGEGDPVLTADEQRAAALCGPDLACVVDALDGNAQWLWVVVGRMEGADVTFEGRTTRGAQTTTARAPRADVDAVNAAAWQAIGLDRGAASIPQPAPVAPAPVPEPARERRPMTAQRAVALSFVPVPGYPAAAAGDWAGFGLGMAAVVPVTAVWVGATGKSTQSPAGHVLLGVGGFYAATVVTNQVLSATRLRDSGIAVGVGPTERGQGAQVTVTVGR